MSKEAIKLALEALEHGLDYAKGEQFENAQRFKGYEHLAPDDTHSIQLIETAIKALEEALAKQEHGEPDYEALWKQMCEPCDELDAKLAKQEHDPYDEVFIAYGLPKQEQGEPVAFIDERGNLQYYKPTDFNQCEYGGLQRLYAKE